MEKQHGIFLSSEVDAVTIWLLATYQTGEWSVTFSRLDTFRTPHSKTRQNRHNQIQAKFRVEIQNLEQS